MKRLALVLAMGVLSITSVFSQKNQTEKDIKMYTQLWDDVINKGEIDKINDTHFTTDITAIAAPENIVGIPGFKAYYQNFLTGFSERQFDILDIFGVDGKLVKHWNFKGKHTGEFFGIPATGNSVDVQGVTLVKMMDGKVAVEQDFMDNAIFMQQLGLVSDPNNLSIIDGLYKAFASGDMPNILGAMDPNIEWNEAEGNSMADGNPYIGPDAILQGVFARIAENNEYFRLVDIELHGMDNNQVLATLRYDAKVKATGKPYNAQVAHLWTLANGKITAFQQYVDTKKLAEAEME
ncbi:MAG: ester cyclase [Maribacter sp.]